jgi:hypothetical protein
MTGTLAQVSPVRPDSLYDTNIFVPSVAQTVSFLVGVFLLIVHTILRVAQ